MGVHQQMFLQNALKQLELLDVKCALNIGLQIILCAK